MFGPFIINTNHEFRSLWEIALLTRRIDWSIYAKEKREEKKKENESGHFYRPMINLWLFLSA